MIRKGTAGSQSEESKGEAILEVLGPVICQGAITSICSHTTCPDKAIKEISVYGLPEKKIAALKTSFQALTCLHHPNIVSSESPVECDGYLYIPMSRYSTSLEAMMRTYRLRKLQFSKTQILAVITQVSAALAYLHNRHGEGTGGAAGIIHGALKPANILISKDGEQYALSDAGIHKHGQQLNSSMYAAPETLTEDGITPVADMWSLGIIVYELVTKSKPNFVEGCAFEDVFTEGWTPDLSGVEDRLLSNIIRRLLVVDPVNRISSSDLLSILRANQSVIELENYFRLDALEREIAQLSSEIFMLRGIIEGAPPSPKDDGLTALMRAARAGDVEVVRKLVDADDGVGSQDAAGLTALMHATLAAHHDVIKILVASEHGIYDNSGQTALMHAAQMNDSQAIALIAKYEASMKTRKWNLVADIPAISRTALMGAAARGSAQAVKALLPYEGQLRDELQRTALMYAASNNHRRAVELLVPHEKKLRDSTKQTALIMAVQSGNTEVIPLLLCEAGMKNKMGYSALMLAASKGYFDIARLLVKREKGLRSPTQGTALITAAYHNHYKIVQLLIPYESRMQNRHGLTAMMEAAKHGHFDVVKLLANYEKGVKDKLERTALAIAIKFERSEIVEFLSRYPEEQCTSPCQKRHRKLNLHDYSTGF